MQHSSHEHSPAATIQPHAHDSQEEGKRQSQGQALRAPQTGGSTNSAAAGSNFSRGATAPQPNQPTTAPADTRSIAACLMLQEGYALLGRPSAVPCTHADSTPLPTAGGAGRRMQGKQTSTKYRGGCWCASSGAQAAAPRLIAGRGPRVQGLRQTSDAQRGCGRRCGQRTAAAAKQGAKVPRVGPAAGSRKEARVWLAVC